MKRFLTFLLLSGSLVFVGCKGITNDIARLHLDEVLAGAKNDNPYLSLCYRDEIIKSSFCRLTIGDLIIVEESAEGEDRVVLKYWAGIFGQDGWNYIGVNFTTADWDAIKALPVEERTIALLEIVQNGFDTYGLLRFEPADNEFFWEDDNGNWNIFSESVASIKDVELMGSKVEDQNAVTLGEKLSAQYGLSNERGQVVAKTLAAYNKLASKRALTSEEKNQFSNNLLGVDYKTAERSVKSGNADDLQVLMERAAQTNGTTPEAVSAIIKDMVL